MASATALLLRVAGRVPAIRVYVAATFIGAVFAPCAVVAEMPHDVRMKMERLYRDLILAEENLNAALRDKDVARGKLINSLLFQWAVNTDKQSQNSCSDALANLGGATISAVLFMYPPITGDLGSLTREELAVRLHKGPDDEMKRQFAEHSSGFKKSMAACEREIGAQPSSRTLSEMLDRIQK